MVSFTVRMVFLFHSSARALGAIATPSNPMDATARTNCFMAYSLVKFHGCIIDTVATGSATLSRSLPAKCSKALRTSKMRISCPSEGGKVLHLMEACVALPSQSDARLPMERVFLPGRSGFQQASQLRLERRHFFFHQPSDFAIAEVAFDAGTKPGDIFRFGEIHFKQEPGSGGQW